jgi:hypothetical protein
MKKLIVAFAAIAITAGAYAQADSTNRKTSPRNLDNKQNQSLQQKPSDQSKVDGVMMQNGKMMKVKNGQATVLDQDMTLSNGTTIKSNGTCKKKDGSKVMLKEGQHIDMSGNLTSTKPNKDKNIYLVPDSTTQKAK